MLTPGEMIAFGLLTAASVTITIYGFLGIYAIIRRGRPAPERKNVIRRFIVTLIQVGAQLTVFRARPVLSIFHTFIFFGFSYYFLVNVNDVLEGFIRGYSTAAVSTGILGIGNLIADVLSVLTLLGMVAFLVRRFLAKDKRLSFNSNVLLHPRVAVGGVRRDSAIVGAFILFHVGSRFLGQALRLAEMRVANPMQPFASLVSQWFVGFPTEAIDLRIHVTWWLAIGLVIVFLPYFVISKHIHLMAAPVNLALAKQTGRGHLDRVFPGLETPVGFTPGAARLEDLAWPRLLDAYACIMCNRCQDVCPAHGSMRPLSPAALEINKRYWLNANFSKFADGAPSPPLTEFAISPEAVWSCTACYACVRVCPVGNEPMADIIDIRRRLVNDGAELDSGIQSTLEKIGKSGNSFGQAMRNRAKWAQAGLAFKIKDIRKEPAEFLWFVGDYASFDARVQEVTRTVARVLHHAGVDFGILYDAERNSGNDVRRVGEEGLFEQLAEQNIAAMSQCTFQRVITTDPHTLNALKNEYPDYGGQWDTIHYTRLLAQLLEQGKMTLTRKLDYRVTFHDPCYLGRYNQGFDPPRLLIRATGCELVEMPRNKENSYCCGAGGGQIWMGTTPAGERPAESRIREALSVLDGRSTNGARGKKLLFVVACPKDVVMYTDAVKTSGSEGKIEVRDVIQLLAESMGEQLHDPTTQPSKSQAPASTPAAGASVSRICVFGL